MIRMQWVYNKDGDKVLQFKYKIEDSLVSMKGVHGTTTYNKDVYSSWQTVKLPE